MLLQDITRLTTAIYRYELTTSMYYLLLYDIIGVQSANKAQKTSKKLYMYFYF